MMIRKNIRFLLLLIPVLIIGLDAPLVAQFSDKTKTESEAITNFQERNFRDALSLYSNLNKLFPQNPDYQYFIGRCLLELRENYTNAIDNLRFAAVRGTISDSWFYLGQAYSGNSEFAKSVSSYKRFIREGKKSEIKRLGAKELLIKAERDFEKSGNMVSGSSMNAEVDVVETSHSDSKILEITDKDVSSSQIIKAKSVEIEQDKSTENTSTEAPMADFSENSNKAQAFEGNNNENLTIALQLQLSADSLSRLAKTKRGELKETDENEQRNILFNEISALEKESQKKQALADKYYLDIQTLPKLVQQEDTIRHVSSVIELEKEINGIKVYRYNAVQMPAKEIPDNTNTISVNDKDKIKQVANSPANQFSLSDIPVYSVTVPIPQRSLFPDRLVYYIQVGVFSKKVGDDFFGGIAPLFYEELVNRGIFKYYAGLFNSFKSAGEALSKLKSSGYTDSFIVAFYKDEQVAVDKAQQIEYAQIKF